MCDEEPPLPAPAFPPAPPSAAPPVAGLNMCIHQFPQKPAAFFLEISATEVEKPEDDETPVIAAGSAPHLKLLVSLWLVHLLVNLPVSFTWDLCMY